MVTKFNHNNVKSQFSRTLTTGLVIYITKALNVLKSLKNKFYAIGMNMTIELLKLLEIKK